jgi:mannose/fructose-specific phosphotransferase system component IIA
MSEPLKAIVISHARVAAALVEAVQVIAGDTGPFVTVSNEGASRESLCADLSAAVGDGPAVIFVDMPGGSCLYAAMAGIRERDDVAVVAGVNLPMLLDFAFHRDLPPAEAATHAVEAGTKSIRTVRT